MTVVALVPAAGRGERLGLGMPKAWVDVDGRPLLWHAVRSLSRCRSRPHRGRRRRRRAGSLPPRCWARMCSSSRAAPTAWRPFEPRWTPPWPTGSAEVVLVHDAARASCRTRPSDGSSTRSAPVRTPWCRCCPLPTRSAGSTDGALQEIVDRDRLRLVQTPQGFRPDVLEAAHRAVDRSRPAPTDDAGLVEEIGATVVVVDGDRPDSRSPHRTTWRRERTRRDSARTAPAT